MSKESLQPLIIAEIIRRQKQREEEILRKEAADREAARQILLTIFKEALDDCVRDLEDFQSYQLSSAVSHTVHLYEEAKKLHLYVYDCLLTYKGSKDDENLTEADKLFSNFEKRLCTARKLRLLDIKQECHYVKQSILDGKFDEDSNHNFRDFPDFSILVPAKFPLKRDEERKVVTKFFTPLDIHYHPNYSENHEKNNLYYWCFHVKK